jgi:hypothetical protein
MANSPEQKLERVLHHFIDSNYRRGSSDGIYMEKLLSHLSGNYDSDITVFSAFLSLFDDTEVNPLSVLQEKAVTS